MDIPVNGLIGDLLLEAVVNALLKFLLEDEKDEEKLLSEAKLFFVDVVVIPPLFDSWGHMAVQSDCVGCLNWSSFVWPPDNLGTGEGVLIVLSEVLPIVDGMIGCEGTGDDPKMAAPVDAPFEFAGAEDLSRYFNKISMNGIMPFHN